MPAPLPDTRVEPYAGPLGRIRPLALEVLGRRDDGDPVDHAPGEQFGGEPQREGGLAGAGRCRGQEVARLGLEISVERFGLPGAQLLGCASRGAFGIRRRKVLGGESPDRLSPASRRR